jgi:hypothetical protein
MAADGKKPGGMRMRAIPFTAGLLAFLFMAALYGAGSRHLYDTILILWGVEPFSFPFLDTETVLSAVRCLRAGVDVFVVNPCDVLGRVYDYSPLWLLLAKLPFTDAWTIPSGLAVDGAFLLSLLLLPHARDGRALFCLLLGLLSSAVVFAVERGNNDLVLFVLAAIASALALRSPLLRVTGYGFALLAGLLKYYPMTLMLMVSRERPRFFLAIAAASLVAVGLFFVAMGPDLVRALRLIPTGSWFGDMFGSSTLPQGLAQILGWSAGGPILHVLFSLIALAAGLAAGLRAGIGQALDRLEESERTFLLAGSLLILGCFFTAQNIGYRATHLVLVLPALTALWRTDHRPVWPLATGAAIALLWSQGWRAMLGRLSAAQEVPLGAWVLRETLWWGLVTLLIALVVNLTVRSTMGRLILPRLRSSAPA